MLDSNKDLYIELSKKIFDNNERRFRLKNYFNIIESSNIKECKSYSNNTCFINIDTENDIYNKIPEINYLCISHDIIYFKNTFKNIIRKLFNNPNICFINDVNLDISSRYNLTLYKINNDMRDNFEFEPIKYKSGGKLGDFVNQLSVVCEKFYETGKKGELFIDDLESIHDKFLFGLENTYNDTYSIINSQNYIKKYKIYNGENFDIDLSTWRNKVNYLVSLGYSWYNIYKHEYNVEWGKHKWLTCSNDSKWNNKIIINIPKYRDISQNAVNKLLQKIGNELNNCVFISNEKEHHAVFCEKTGINIEYYKPKNFEETAIIINSCKIGYFGFSSCAVIANGLHKSNIVMGVNILDAVLNNLTNNLPHVLDFFS